jgi:hypothetical protein
MASADGKFNKQRQDGARRRQIQRATARWRASTATSTSNGKMMRVDGKFNKQRRYAALPGKLHRDAKGA